MDYMTQPLTGFQYHFTQVSGLLICATLWGILYQVNRQALTARQNPMSLAPLPKAPRRRRWQARAKYQLARLIVRVGLVRLPHQTTRVSAWRLAGQAGAARRRI